MSFGHQTTLTLTVDACATLPDIKLSDVSRRIDEDQKEKAEFAFKLAENERTEALNRLLEYVPQAPTPPPTDSAYHRELEARQRAYVEKANAFSAAEEKKNQYVVPSDDGKKEQRPNAFVAVTLDEDSLSSDPIVFTSTYREDNRPFWHESFKEIPIGLLAHGKWGRQLLNGDKSAYCPTRLNFWIYHDLGNDKKPSDTSWKRPTPKRDYLIGRAWLSFGTLFCDSKETWHSLPVLDIYENPIADCHLRIKTELGVAKKSECVPTLPVRFDLTPSVYPTLDDVKVKKSFALPGGLVCGKVVQDPPELFALPGGYVCKKVEKSSEKVCGSSCSCGDHFQRPAHNHKRSKKKKCCKHSHYRTHGHSCHG